MIDPAIKYNIILGLWSGVGATIIYGVSEVLTKAVCKSLNKKPTMLWQVILLLLPSAYSMVLINL